MTALDFLTYNTPAEVLACMSPTFNQEVMGVASDWSEVEAIVAAMPAGYRFSCIQPVGNGNPNRHFRTDEDYRYWVNPTVCLLPRERNA